MKSKEIQVCCLLWYVLTFYYFFQGPLRTPFGIGGVPGMQRPRIPMDMMRPRAPLLGPSPPGLIHSTSLPNCFPLIILSFCESRVVSLHNWTA